MNASFTPMIGKGWIKAKERVDILAVDEFLKIPG
jgi:hypothetical protein